MFQGVRLTNRKPVFQASIVRVELLVSGKSLDQKAWPLSAGRVVSGGFGSRIWQGVLCSWDLKNNRDTTGGLVEQKQ